MNLPSKPVRIPVDKIRVINSRIRNDGKFQEIVESILKLGMKEPIVVSRQAEGDLYDLVCGEGRLLAHRKIGRTEVHALVVEASLEDRLLVGILENLGRRTRTTVEHAREYVAMKERGYTISEIARKVGLSETYVAGAIRLLSKGEERLVDAVERNEIPISVAMDIARLDDETMQQNLADAYATEGLRGRELQRVRRVVAQRKLIGKGLRATPGTRRKTRANSRVSVMRAYKKEASRREALVKKSRLYEEQVGFLLTSYKALFKDKTFVSIIRTEKLSDFPKPLLEAMKRS
ncbi:MAG TPA: ParB/RepB/Spo0J family partition protein [Spirochaetia bacterium]